MVNRIVAPRVDHLESVQIEVADAPVRWRLNGIPESQVQGELTRCPHIILDESCKIPKAIGPRASCCVLIFVYGKSQQNVGDRIPAAAGGQVGRVLPGERHLTLRRLKHEEIQGLPPEITSNLHAVSAVNQRDGVRNLIEVFSDTFRRKLRITQALIAAGMNAQQMRRIVVPIAVGDNSEWLLGLAGVLRKPDNGRTEESTVEIVHKSAETVSPAERPMLISIIDRASVIVG